LFYQNQNPPLLQIQANSKFPSFVQFQTLTSAWRLQISVNPRRRLLVNYV